MAIYGRQPYGVGTPAVLQDTGGKVLSNPYYGNREGSRKIDPRTRDYVLDSTTGRILGMTNPQQLVYLAVSTTRGSSAVQALGHELGKIDRISANFTRRVDGALRAAVQHIVDRGLIEVVAIEVQVLRPGQGFARLRWRDTATGHEEETLVGEAHSSSESLQVPVILASNYSLVDTVGGNSVVLSGIYLGGASSITVGGTSASITANTATSLTFTMPAKSAGTYDIVVTTSRGTSSPYPIEAWDPTAISSITGYWRASYTGSPWSGLVSARNLTELFNAPAVGGSVNGFTPADFDGSSQQLSTSSNVSTFYSTAAYSMAALVYIDTFTVTDPGYALPYNCSSILGEPLLSGTTSPAGGVAGSGASGVFRFGHKDGTSATWKSASVNVSTGSWILVRASYDGASIKVSKNAEAWNLAGSANPGTFGSAPLMIGPNNPATAYFDGKVLCGMTANAAVSDSDYDKLRRYCNLRYALSL